MKSPFPVLAVLIVLLAAPPAQAAFSQWVDDNGVVHFTDKRSNIPQRYRKKAKELTLQEEPPATNSAPPAQQAPPPVPPAPAAAQPAAPGGHDEAWWRQSFTALRTRLQTLQQGLLQKQGKL